MTHQLVTNAPRFEITATHHLYPAALKCMERPPARLHLIGSLNALNEPLLAIVGARKATPYGLRCARHFARLAAVRGINIVSGGAIGCDQAAHQGALEVGGKTIVVMGCGADIVYPSKATELFSQVVEEGGAIVSEAPWGAPPTRWGFKKRNRIIAGLAQATLIAEAGVPSGTFSTADAALAQGKEVLAIPGSIFAKESRGANQLILQGALPIVDGESFSDVLMQLFGVQQIVLPMSAGTTTGVFAAGAPAVPSSLETSLQHKVLCVLEQEPLRAESLCGICGDNIVEVVRYLSTMELRGLVSRLRDGRYATTSH